MAGKKGLVKLKELIREIDPEAFLIVRDAREAMGMGFTGEKREKKKEAAL